jgi:hypothetical protein
VTRLPVTAVAGTAGAVGGLADSPIVVAMTRSRLWIGILGLLLGGIVAVQVLGLSQSALGSRNAEKIEDLQQQNNVLASRIARRSSTEKISAMAADLGLETTTPKGIDYIDAHSSNAADAAKRLTNGEIEVLSTLPTTSDVVGGEEETTDATAATTTTTTYDPVTGAPIDPAATATTTTTAPVYDPVTGNQIDPMTGQPIGPPATTTTTP